MRLSSELEIIILSSPHCHVFDDEMSNKAITTFKEGLLRLITAKGRRPVQVVPVSDDRQETPGSRQIRR
jgi:hypothetical protein